VTASWAPSIVGWRRLRLAVLQRGIERILESKIGLGPSCQLIELAQGRRQANQAGDRALERDERAEPRVPGAKAVAQLTPVAGGCARGVRRAPCVDQSPELGGDRARRLGETRRQPGQPLQRGN